MLGLLSKVQVVKRVNRRGYHGATKVVSAMNVL